MHRSGSSSRRRRAFVSILAAATLAAPRFVSAGTKVFSTTESDWLLPTNWTPAGVPTVQDDAFIVGGTADMHLDSDLTLRTLTFNTPAGRLLDTNNAAGVTLTLDGGTSSAGLPTLLEVAEDAIASVGRDLSAQPLKVGLKLAKSGTFLVHVRAAVSINGDITEGSTPADLLITGGGAVTLRAAAANTGSIDISGAGTALKVSGEIGWLANTRPVRISSGGSLVLDNTGPLRDDRIADSADLELRGGTLQMLGGNSGSGLPPITEHVAALKVKEKANRVLWGIGGNVDLSFTSLTHDVGATLDVQSNGDGKVRFTSPPPPISGIIGSWATVNGQDWAAIDGTGAVSALSSYNTNPDPTTWTPADNVAISSPSTVLTGDTEVNSIKILNTATVANQGFGLKTSGILLASGNATISDGGGGGGSGGSGGGFLAAKSGEKNIGLYVSEVSSQLTIDVPILDPTGELAITQSGLGSVILGRTCSCPAGYYVNSGKLVAGQFASLIDSALNLSEDGLLVVESGTTPFSTGGLSGGGAIQLSRGIVTAKPSGGTTASKVYAGAISGTGSVTVQNDQTFTGVSSYTGDTIVAGGTLTLSGDGALTKTAMLKLGVANGGVERPGTAMLVGGGNRINDAATLEMSGGTLEMSSFTSDPYVETIALMKAKEKANRTKCGNNLRLVAGGLVRETGASLDFESSGGSTGVSFTSPPPMLNDIVGAWATVDGSDWAKFSPTGEVVPFADYETSPNSLIWSPRSNVDLYGASNSISIAAKTSINTIKLGTAGTQDVATGGEFAVGGILVAGGDVTISGTGNIVANNGGNGVEVRSKPGTTLHVSKPIADTTEPINLTLAGGGKLSLEADNPMSGTIFVNEGTLELTQNGKIYLATVSTGPGVFNPGAWNKTIGGLSGSGNVNLSGGAALAIGNNDQSTEYSGVMVGNGEIIKIGRGTLTLSGSQASAYAGPTTIQQGTLAVDSLQRLGGDILIHGDATFAANDDLVIPPTQHITLVGGGTAGIEVAEGKTLRVGGNVGINETIPDTTLHVRGRGTLELTGENVISGRVRIAGTRTVLSDPQAKFGAISGMHIDGGGELILGGLLSPSSNRINDVADIELAGGTLSLIGNGSTTPEVVGLMKAKEKANRTKCQNNARLISSGLVRDLGATIDFETDGTTAGVQFVSPPTLTHGIIGAWATVNGTDWATVSANGSVVPYTGYTSHPDPLDWTASENISFPATEDVTIIPATTTVNTYRQDFGPVQPNKHRTLQLSPGVRFKTNGILINDGDFQIIGGSGVTAPDGSSELRIRVHEGLAPRVSTPIQDNGQRVSVLLDGGGTLVFEGDNTYTGATKVSRSTLKTFFQAGDKPTQSQFVLSDDGTLDITHADQTIGSLEGTGRVLHGSSTLTVGINNLSTQYDGDFIATGGGLTLTGLGEMTIGGHVDLGGGDLRINNLRTRIDQLEARLQNIGLLRLGNPTTPGTLEITDLEGGQLSATFIENGGGTLKKPKRFGIGNTAPVVISQLSGGGPFTDAGGSSKYVTPCNLTGPMVFDGSAVSIEADGALLNTASITLQGNAQMKVNKAGDTMTGNRISNTAPITLNGGSLIISNISGVPTSETMGTLNVKEYNNTLSYQVGDTAVFNQVIYQSLIHTGDGTIDFHLPANAAVSFTAAPQQTSEIIGPWAVINSRDWAAVAPGGNRIWPLPGYKVSSNPSNWLPTDNISLDDSAPDDIAITGKVETFTVKQEFGPQQATRHERLAISPGSSLGTNGILVSDTGNLRITGPGTLSALPGSASINLWNFGPSELTIAAPITDNGQPVTIIKSGDGTMTIDAPIQSTGPVIFNNGRNLLTSNVGSLPKISDFGLSRVIVDTGTKPLRVGDLDGDGILELRRGIITVKPGTGSAGSTTARGFAGQITGPGSFTVRGGSEYTLTGVTEYTGGTTVNDTTLTYDGQSTMRGTTRLDFGQAKIRRPRDVSSSRVAPNTTVESNGGTLTMEMDFTPWSETVGLYRAIGGENTVSIKVGESGGANEGTIRFTGTDFQGRLRVNLRKDPGGDFHFASPPALTNGIVGNGFATMNDVDWLAFDTAGKAIAYAGYQTNQNPAVWSSTDNVAITGSIDFTQDKTVHTALIRAEAELGLLKIENQKRLRTNSVLSAASITIDGPGTVSSPSDQLHVIAAVANKEIKLKAAIADGDTPLNLVKSGPGTLTLSGDNTYSGRTIINAGTLAVANFKSIRKSTAIDLHHATFARATGGGAILIPQIDVTVSGSSTINTNSGAMSVHDITGEGALAVSGGGTLLVHRISIDSTLSVKAASNPGQVTKAQVGLGNVNDRTTSVVGGLSIDTGAQLDLTNNRMTVYSSAGSLSRSGVEVSLRSGRNDGPEGTVWQGSGIVTSMLDAGPASLLTTLAVASASDLKVGVWGDVIVEPDETLIAYTYTGDATLDGKIDADDYFQIDSNLNKPSSDARYFTGDFDYDGQITGDDYFLIDNAFAGQGAPLLGASGLSGVSAVPEPGVGLVISAGIASLLRRKRRS